MRNLMKQIATSLSLMMIMGSLLVIGNDQAQAKAKKKAGNSAKVKSNAKRRGNTKMHLEDISLGKVKK